LVLTHVNPYTGLALKDDPFYMEAILSMSPPFSRGLANRTFPALLGRTAKVVHGMGGNPFDGAQGRWQDYPLQIRLGNPEIIADPEPGKRRQFPSFPASGSHQDQPGNESLLEKVKPPRLAVGSNMGMPTLGNIKSDSVMDFMDTHAYWDPPQIWNIEAAGPTWPSRR